MGTLLYRRRYMGGVKGLPYDAEVEYLESDGTQYINTGIIPTNTIGVEISILYSNSKNVLIGGGNAWSQEFLIARDGKSIIFNANHSSGTRISRGNSYAGSQHIYKYENGDCYIDGELVGTNSPSIPTTTKTLCVLCYNRNSGQGEFLVGKLYYVKILNNGVLQRDLIPVRVGTIGYMYDKISGTLFGNSGTGSFILGPDKT